MRIGLQSLALTVAVGALAGAAAPALFASAPAVFASAAPQGEYVALHAGTVYLVEGAQVLHGDITVLVRDGRILAIGPDVSVPANASVVDYGPDAVLIPGLVAADGALAYSNASMRTAEPSLSGLEQFDFYAQQTAALSGGVTSAYIAPARARLIAGQGALVKLAGDDFDTRVLNPHAALHGSIAMDARNAPGYWEPPVPPTSDVGLGVAEQQLPRTLVGAMLALRELVGTARAGAAQAAPSAFGPYAAEGLAEVLRARTPWRISAYEATEVRALLDFGRTQGVPLIIDGAHGAGDLGREIAAAGAAVIYSVPFTPNQTGRDLGKSPQAEWPSYDVPSKLALEKVRLAISTGVFLPVRDLRFAAALASRGGLSEELALRAITLTPAELYGAAGRVGSLAPGKDADFVVLNGAPLDLGSSVLATWVGGELVYDAPRAAGSALVVEVERLHLGDGEVLSPGQVLIKDGRIAEVGRQVAHPRGAQVVRAPAAMPGMIDAMGHLGLEGSGKSVGSDFRFARILGPGDDADRRVALAGVTTVAISTRATNSSGTPVAAYKPAASEFDRLMVGDPVAVRLRWNDRNRARSGADVRELLEKSLKYRDSWSEYEKALAAWKAEPEAYVPPPARVHADKPAEEGAAGEKKDDKKDEKSDKDEKKEDDSAKKKGKKDKDAKEEPADPVTGIWQGDFARPPHEGSTSIRLQLKNEAGAVHGSLRCDWLSEGLMLVSGTFADKQLVLNGVCAEGGFQVLGKIEKAKFDGQVLLAGANCDFDLGQTATEYPIASVPEKRKPKTEEAAKPAKPAPQPPKLDEKLEPLRQAMLGQSAVLVEVEREDEILACVDAFAAAGIQPVLVGAGELMRVVSQVRGRIGGALPGMNVAFNEAKRPVGELRTPYSELQDAGVPVAFRSNAEEGAADLPLIAAYAIAQGLSPTGALRALTSDAARLLRIDDHVGRLASGLDGDLLLLDGDPLDPRTRILRTFVNGREVIR